MKRKKILHKKNKNSTSKYIPQYPSSNIMLSEVKSVYNDENDRNKNLENKASIGITLLGVLLTVGINELNINKLIHIKIHNFSNILLNLILVLVLSIMVIMLALALYNFYQTIKPQYYQKMSTDGFLKENGECHEDIISMTLIDIYVGIINHNRNINDEKSKFIDNGMRYLIICIVSYVVYSLIYKFI